MAATTLASAVDAYVDSLRAAHPGARFEISGVQVVSGLMVVTWQGAIDDTVVVSGRTLITVEDGRVVRLAFVSQNDISPAGGAALGT